MFRGVSIHVAVNCAAIPSELLESELFGYRRGAFTGANKDHAGLFEEANHGTLFLDEIGEMPLPLQAKLTRALEERAVRRLGESGERPVDVRLIAATHQDLAAMVQAGTFRQDLWYRMNVAVIRIPALRERPEDIEMLAAHFLRELAAISGRNSVRDFSETALDAMKSYSWSTILVAAVDKAAVESRLSRRSHGEAQVVGQISSAVFASPDAHLFSASERRCQRHCIPHMLKSSARGWRCGRGRIRFAPHGWLMSQ